MPSDQPRPILLGRPGEDIGRKELSAAIQRFRALHGAQVRRIQECQAPRQRDFLDILALLFHCNHPVLPGFVTVDTPAGLPEYHPTRPALEAAARLSRSFEYKRRALTEYPIQGLYLMGSVGSIAYSRKSDLDIWLCHRSGMEAPALDELHRKAAAIERWAASLGLEAHIFFIDAERFRLGEGTPISTESCGSVQHHLLLEEFYRTALWLAGRAPAWWLVPPGEDERYGDYLRHLLDKRFIKPQEVVDFGGLERVSPDEFLGGTLWHLHKAIGSPHKSLLKLFLMESYAAEYPHPRWLCSLMKQEVYAGHLEREKLDSYLLVYRKVEQFLKARAEPARLDLARLCFYLKINEAPGRTDLSPAEKRMRREVLDGMTRAWGWPPERVRDLDARRRWRLVQALEEHQLIVGELRSSFQAVRRFALEHGENGGQAVPEIRLLGRRLSAALERKPGKVEKLHLDAGAHIGEEEFSLHEIRVADAGPGWGLAVGRVRRSKTAEAAFVRKAHSLLELLAWLAVNKLYRRTTQLTLETLESRLTPADLKSTLDALAIFLSNLPPESDSLEEYARLPRIRTAALFINLGVDAEAERRDGLLVASSRDDALSYGQVRNNLIQQVDALLVTSWGEILVRRHAGLSGLFDCMVELLGQAETDARIECFCFVPGRARSLANRVSELYHGLSAAFPPRQEPARYLVRGGSAFFLFERGADGLRYREIAGEGDLYAVLGSAAETFQPLLFDSRIVADVFPLPLLYAHNRPGIIQVFCLPEAGQTRIYVLDERGSLFQGTHEPCNPRWALGPYALFLDAALQRYVLAAREIEYCLVERVATGGHAVKPAGFRPEPLGTWLDVRVFAEDTGRGGVAYSLYCNEREFSSMEAGQDVFAEVARHVLLLRQSGDRYPVYVSDIGIPPALLGADVSEPLQTVHLLRYKHKLEEWLNGRV